MVHMGLTESAQSFIDGCRRRYEAMDERGRFRITLIILAAITVFASLALFISDFVTGGCDDLTKSFGDVAHYYINISQVTDDHLWPYSEAPLEYPPFTLVVFLIPKLIAWGWPAYHLVYDIFAGMAFAVFVYYGFRIMDSLGKDRFSFLCFFLIVLGVSNQMIFERNDVFAAMFITMALYYTLKDRVCLPAVLIACAAMIKIYPVVLVPVFMIMYMSRREWRNALVFPVVSGLTCLLMELPFLIADPGSAFSWVSYHSVRGLQVEGVVSSFVTVADMFVDCVDSIYLDESQSISLHGQFPDAIASVMNYILAVMLVIVLAVMLYRAYRRGFTERKDTFRLLALMSLITVMTFITFSKVYSAQYSIWILTLIPFVIGPRNAYNRRFSITVVAFCLASFMSQCFAFTMGSGIMDNAVCLVILAKNLVHLYLYYLLIRMFLDYTSGDEGRYEEQMMPEASSA